MLLDLTFMLHNETQERSQAANERMPSWSALEDQDFPGSLPDTTTTSARSSSIPFPSSHVARTQSELQLSLDQAAAEKRDAEMFYRLVNGIRERHACDEQQMALSEKSIASIIQTRLGNRGNNSSSSSRQDVSPDDNNWRLLHAARETISDTTATAQSDEWSITGFDESAHQQAPLQPSDGHEDDHDDADEIFDMEL